MDDRKLEQLLKMAMEAESLEAPQLRLSGSSRRPWMMPFAAGMAAAAAVVAVVTLVLPAVRRSNSSLPIASGGGPTKREATGISERPVAAASTGSFDTPMPPVVQLTNDTNPRESSVVLAFFQGLDGKCTCMHIQNEDWDGTQLANKDRSELLDVAFRSTCLGPTPKVFVVGIAGREDALPKTMEDAEALMNRLKDAPQASRADLASYAYEAMPQLPAGSTIVAETFGHGRGMPSLTQPAKFNR